MMWLELAYGNYGLMSQEHHDHYGRKHPEYSVTNIYMNGFDGGDW